MVLGMTPKHYKHFKRNIISQLIHYESITTTNAKAKHILRHGNKLILFAKKADRGERSAINLLPGRVSTDIVKQKLMLEIIPRLRNMKQNFIIVSKIYKFRKGDSAPLVRVSIKGSQKLEALRPLYDKTKQPGYVDINARCKSILEEEKAYYEDVIKRKPEMAQFLRGKLARVEYQQWTFEKDRKEPARLSLLV